MENKCRIFFGGKGTVIKDEMTERSCSSTVRVLAKRCNLWRRIHWQLWWLSGAFITPRRFWINRILQNWWIIVWQCASQHTWCDRTRGLYVSNISRLPRELIGLNPLLRSDLRFLLQIFLGLLLVWFHTKRQAQECVTELLHHPVVDPLCSYLETRPWKGRWKKLLLGWRCHSRRARWKRQITIVDRLYVLWVRLCIYLINL